jgi:hypothetical protein
MRNLVVAAVATLALAACSTSPHALAPDTEQGPTSYVCYSSMTSSPEDVRAIGERQCRKAGQGLSSMIGQTWTPLRCGFLTPSVVAFQCGGSSSYSPLYR